MAAATATDTKDVVAQADVLFNDSSVDELTRYNKVKALASSVDNMSQESTVAPPKNAKGIEKAEIELYWSYLPHVLVRQAKGCYELADTKPLDKEFRLRYLREALGYADNAVSLDKALRANSDYPPCGLAYKWVAIICGLLEPYADGTKHRIQLGHKVKEHGDEAARLLPNDPYVFVVLTEFCMGVAKLSWLERKAASLLFATPPESNYNEALEYALRVCTLLEKEGQENPKSRGLTVRPCRNAAKCYEELGQKKEAEIWLQKGISLNRDLTEAEKNMQREMRQTLKNL